LGVELALSKTMLTQLQSEPDRNVIALWFASRCCRKIGQRVELVVRAREVREPRERLKQGQDRVAVELEGLALRERPECGMKM
jgi:hypothetical protein